MDWQQYRQQARQRGSLAFEVYIVHSTPVADLEQVKQHLAEHLDYQRQLEHEGSLMLAGPISDESGNEMNGTGFIVYKAKSLEAARSMAEADPMHISGARSYTLKRWLINEGSLNLSVKLSQQSVELGD